MKRTSFLLLTGLLVLLAVLIVNTLRFSSQQLTDVPLAPALIRFPTDSAVARLSAAIRCRTVSFTDYSLTDTTQFDKFLALIRRQFPLTHQQLRLETVNNYGLLYTWPGQDSRLPPILLTAHYDVVPVIQGTERMWKIPPFSGRVNDGFVYGRGTLDDKQSVMALLETVEYLLTTGFQPTRTILLAFGQDEEIAGERGAKGISSLLEKRGVRPLMVLDEGDGVMLDGVPGMSKPVAFVDIGEKGYLSLNLTAVGEGGHSSMPPRQTSITIIAAAITKLEANPFPDRLEGGMKQLLRYLGPEMPVGYRVVLANEWLCGWLIQYKLSKSPAWNASSHTTIAPTIIRAGQKDNVLPIEAMVTVNFRILPGETIEAVKARVREVIDDERIDISVLGLATEPSRLSDPEAEAFKHLQRTICNVYPDAVVAPSLLIGATDARHYERICPNVYRFTPMRLTDSMLAMYHGTNERIAISEYVNMVRFYVTLIQNLSPDWKPIAPN